MQQDLDNLHIDADWSPGDWVPYGMGRVRTNPYITVEVRGNLHLTFDPSELDEGETVEDLIKCHFDRTPLKFSTPDGAGWEMWVTDFKIQRVTDGQADVFPMEWKISY